MFEASIYTCMEPPPALDCHSVQCSVTVVLGAQGPGLHSRLGTLGAAVQAGLRRSRLER